MGKYINSERKTTVKLSMNGIMNWRNASYSIDIHFEVLHEESCAKD